MSRSLRLTFVLLVAVCSALPAQAAPHPDATFRRERVYLHCVSDVIREDNLAGGVVTWDTTPPGGAFVGDGDGCSSTQLVDQDPPVVGNVGSFRIAGGFTGNLESLTVQLHDLGHGSMHDMEGGLLPIDVSLEVDGERVIDNATVIVEPVSENSGVTDLVVFSVDGLDLAPEEGNGAIERQYTLSFITDPGIIFVYDAQEVPAGITFNPPALAEAVISVE